MIQRSFSAKLPPKKLNNSERREREHLSAGEVTKLIAAAKKVGRHRHRDATLILLMYRHGLRVAEVIRLRWQVFDLDAEQFFVRRVKHGLSATHPLGTDELRALRKLRRDYPDTTHVFVSERGGPLTARSVHHIVARAGERAGLPFPIHPHMLRHACGFYLANKGVDTRTIQGYLGHRNIEHTVRYTDLAPNRFNNLWDD
jgi:site-specific recombinase XerD